MTQPSSTYPIHLPLVCSQSSPNTPPPPHTHAPAGGRQKKQKAPRPRAPVFTARIVLLGTPCPDWAADMRARLLDEGGYDPCMISIACSPLTSARPHTNHFTSCPPPKKKQGWMEDRVQVLPLPDPAAYSEAKWVAYMR